MKKLFAVFWIIAVMFGAEVAFADDENSSKMTFDNVTFSKPYKIKGYASVTMLGFKFVDIYAQWNDGKARPVNNGWGGLHDGGVFDKKPRGRYYYRYDDCIPQRSGEEAEFAWLKVDVRNLQKVSASFIKDITVKVIFDDEYEYDGWCRQFNYDYSKQEIAIGGETSIIGWPVCLSPVDEMSIAPMYNGHYVFGCTLPNSVIEDKDSPLRIEINLGENKLIYNVR